MATSAGWWFEEELMVEILYTPAGRPSVISTVRTPLTASLFKPLKNTKVVGSVTLVEAISSIC